MELGLIEQFVLRFVIGGAFVSAFALIGDILRPKSFAGLFGAAPSIALASLTLTIGRHGPEYAASEARTMICGALAFIVYAYIASRLMFSYKISARIAAFCTLPIWFVVAFLVWFSGVR